ncbi:hypothetical protein BLOT_016352 [Blomia tropicalis]|nr:hypothetical protein BLOT_016352 [Blomia tropicalis]
MVFLLVASMIHDNSVIFLTLLQEKTWTTSITATENDFIISLNHLNQNNHKDSDKSEHLSWKHFCWVLGLVYSSDNNHQKTKEKPI